MLTIHAAKYFTITELNKMFSVQNAEGKILPNPKAKKKLASKKIVSEAGDPGTKERVLFMLKKLPMVFHYLKGRILNCNRFGMGFANIAFPVPKSICT